MKISRNDPFDLNLCIRGLGNLVTYMHAECYEYMYYFTFKRALKSLSKDFQNAWEEPFETTSFFIDVDDSFVRLCLESSQKIYHFKEDLILRFGILEEDDLEDEEIILQSARFKPYFLVHKRSKSYKKLKTFYERSAKDNIESLYLYACAITAASYKIPLILKKQFTLAEKDTLRLLNHDDATVELIVDLIIALRKDLEIFQGLSAITSKVKRDIYYKECLQQL
jgi:hypothetical protein